MATPQNETTTFYKAKPHPLEFYALGKVANPVPLTTTFQPSLGFRGLSNDLLQRNAFSINNHNFDEAKGYYKKYVPVGPQNMEKVDIPNCYKTYQKFNLPTNMTNKETYNITKEKLFAQDRPSNLTSGRFVSKNDFLSQKKNALVIQTDATKLEPINKENANGFDGKSNEGKTVLLKDKVFIYDCNNHPFRRGRDIPVRSQTEQGKTKISKDAPDWFNVCPDWKVKQFNDYLVKNEDTISVFSRYQNWITVTPKHKDRRHPLEKAKATKKEQTSRIMPKWMEIRNSQSTRLPENLKSVEYYPEKQKAKKMMVWVDKDLNEKKKIGSTVDESRSIFAIGDFRHNLLTKEQARFYDTKVSQKPKKFFDWDDGKRFNPKYKHDI